MLTGAVLGIALPKLRESDQRLRSSERGLVLAIASAQQRALARQHDVRLLFDTAAGAVRVHDDADNDGELDAGEGVSRVTLADGIRFTSSGTVSEGTAAATFRTDATGTPVLVFRRSGIGSQAGSVFLGTARSASGVRPREARQIRVERTGRPVRMHAQHDGWHRVDR